jgi:hypothetical protein
MFEAGEINILRITGVRFFRVLNCPWGRLMPGKEQEAATSRARVAGEYRRFIPTGNIPETMTAAGIGHWPRNALRHSFASYHIAHFRDAAALALKMGHATIARCQRKEADGVRGPSLFSK